MYHPNIDLQGKVCLNILREDWKPTLSITSVVLGMQFLFMEPNPGDPLNKKAAETMMQDEAQFKRNVAMSMRGGRVSLPRAPACSLGAAAADLFVARCSLLPAQVDGEVFARTLVTNKRQYEEYGY